ncbi:reverse transcriptase domain-containing protein [Tanacetum coccineum]|uniref:Reverse transcriptase domain-containing protein n=1 Tax=Tanacetum coccineum TaxID=301880 RepID=A0ABQ5H5W7_9ASTR
MPALTKDHKGKKINTPYPEEVNLDNSTNNVLIPLDSWTSGLLEYKLSLSSKMDSYADALIVTDLMCLGLRMKSHPKSKNDMTLRDKYDVSIIWNRIRTLCKTRSLTNKLFTPYKEPEREFRSSRRHFKTLSLDELRSPDFNLLSDQEYSEEEVAETMAETMEQYMSKTRADYGSGVARPKIEDKDNFELKGQFLKELRTNTFSGSDHKDANKHIEKVLEIVDLFHIPNITIDQVMLRAFLMSLTGAASRWLRNEPTGSITTWDGLKTKFLNKYCPPARTAKKMEEINNFQQEPDENLYQAWERFKELLMKCPQHYLTEMQEVILFYNGLGIPTRQILDSRGAIPSKNVGEYSQKWHNGTSRSRSTETSDGLAAIQAQLNNLGREIKKVNEKVYAAQVGCEQCKGPHYTKDFPLKEEGKTLEEAYYTQFGGPFQGGGYRAAASGFYQRNNANPSYQE